MSCVFFSRSWSPFFQDSFSLDLTDSSCLPGQGATEVCLPGVICVLEKQTQALVLTEPSRQHPDELYLSLCL